VRLKLYGRTYCHLCTDMQEALQALAVELGFSVEYRDVDAEPLLEERYGDLVPVLEDERGEEICHYFLDEDALRRRLAVK